MIFIIMSIEIIIYYNAIQKKQLPDYLQHQGDSLKFEIDILS